MKIGHGCRGLIEFRAQVTGETGHAAKGNGTNAIDGVFRSLEDLRKYLDNYKHPIMCQISMNLAYLLGGQEQEGVSYRADGKFIAVKEQGNIIPDIDEFVVDVRPSSPDLTAEKIVSELENSAVANGCRFVGAKLRHQLGAWYTDLSEIEEFLELAKEVTGKKAVDLSG